MNVGVLGMGGKIRGQNQVRNVNGVEVQGNENQKVQGNENQIKHRVAQKYQNKMKKVKMMKINLPMVRMSLP